MSITKEKLDLLKTKLADKNWRITSGMLYYIKNKDGEKVPFIPNAVQRDFLENMHNRNVILKSRQLGFTTLIAILILDEFLFSSYKDLGVIAQSIDDAEKIFDGKIKFGFDNLPERLKEHYELKTERKGELQSKRNSTNVSVDTSFRGGTLQILHVSEFGKIGARFPDKAEEIVTGALNTANVSSKIFIESTAEGNSGHFYDFVQLAMQNAIKGTKLSQLDYKFFFYPRFIDQANTLDHDEELTSETIKYFVSLQNDPYIIEHYPEIDFSRSQMLWYQKKEQEQGDNMKREHPSTPQEAFMQSTKGSYYEKEMATVMRQGRISSFPHDPRLPVYTVRDLGGAGGGDSTAIRFAQVFNREIRLIDYWEGNGMSMIEIIEMVVKSKDYQYRIHYLPHDAEVTEYSTGITRKETAIQHLENPVLIVPKISISDGIDAVRDILPQSYFNEATTTKGVSSLLSYSRKWIKSLGEFSDKPNHDQYSHGADAFRYLAIALNRLISPTKSQTVQANYKNQL